MITYLLKVLDLGSLDTPLMLLPSPFALALCPSSIANPRCRRYVRCYSCDLGLVASGSTLLVLQALF